MKPHNSTLIVLVIAALSLGAGTITAAPLGTAFTYQGQLTDGGNPANGTYELKFTLFDTNSGGITVAGPRTNSAVGVTNGLFTTAMDLGSGVFTGEARWLNSPRLFRANRSLRRPTRCMRPAPAPRPRPKARRPGWSAISAWRPGP
jgi:hypothetical protein